MKYFLFSITVSFGILLFSFSDKEKPIEDQCREYALKHIDKILASIENSQNALNLKLNDKQLYGELIKHYHEARKNYKEIEFFIEYYSPYDAKYFINGPLVQKQDPEYGSKVFEPHGFQVIEQQLFLQKGTFEILKQEFIRLKGKFLQLKNYYSTIKIEIPNLTEALRLEVIRIMCLTLNGYDCTISKEALIECRYSLNGISDMLRPFHFLSSNVPEHIQMNISKNSCIMILENSSDSDKFDRLSFITKYLNPFYSSLVACFNRSGMNKSKVNYAVDLNKAAHFSISSLNKQHFSLYRNDTLHQKEQAELGRLLFFDPLLSGNNKRACASCHKPGLGFADGLDRSFDFEQKNKVSRNSPTLLNAAYQKSFFYDGRIFNLEEQSGAVFHNTFEMNTNAEEIVKKLRQSDEYINLFRRAYKGSIDSSLTFYAVMHSISEYIKTLDSKNSRFDKYISGDTTQLNKQEINGFNLFAGKALCGSCHFYPLFNGTVPPMYNENEFEVLGVPSDSSNKNSDTDVGREKITRSPVHHSAFKTPTVRNVAITAPYMHNGIYSNLDQVLNFYNKGGGAGLKLKVGNQTLPFDSLNLSKTELKELRSFLLSLTDTSGTQNIPKRLPSFNNQALDKRKIGGEY